MKKYMILIILLSYFSCKKGDGSGKNNWRMPMIKTETVNTATITYSYDRDGRITKLEDGDWIITEFTYFEDSINLKTTELATSAVDKLGLKLTATGRLASQGGTEYKYDGSDRLSEVLSPPQSSGWQTREKYYYNSTTGFLDSMRKTEFRLLQTNWLQTTIYTYYTDVEETHGNENKGMGFWGKNDLHPVKHYETWAPIPAAPYRKITYIIDRQYGYDDAGRIVVQDHSEKRPDNTNVQWRTVYTYY
jgi:YD repeat-containing protein